MIVLMLIGILLAFASMRLLVRVWNDGLSDPTVLIPVASAGFFFLAIGIVLVALALQPVLFKG